MKIESYAFNADVTWDQWSKNQCMLIAQHHGIELKEDEIQNWLAQELEEDEDTPDGAQTVGPRTWARCDGNSVPNWPDWMVEPDISAIIILGHPELISTGFLEELLIREKNFARPFCHKDWGDVTNRDFKTIGPDEVVPNPDYPIGCSNLAESEYCTHWFAWERLGADPELPTIPGQEGWIIAYRNCYCS